ncbi:MAG: hypothetical protein LBQ77_05305 [Treponema sp.]|jgi:hypothetical protein|nr:hypothetical protein [Treponema sp.]
MKKFVITVLFSVVSLSVSAQLITKTTDYDLPVIIHPLDGYRGAVFIDPIPSFAATWFTGLGIAGGTEWAPWDFLSFRLNAYVLHMDTANIFSAFSGTTSSLSENSFTFLQLGLGVRYYFEQNWLQGFYADIGGGVLLAMSQVDGTDVDGSPFIIPKVSTGVGYKFLFTTREVRQVFFFEPTVLYNYSFKPEDIEINWGTATFLGLAGFSVNLGFGILF